VFVVIDQFSYSSVVTLFEIEIQFLVRDIRMFSVRKEEISACGRYYDRGKSPPPPRSRTVVLTNTSFNKGYGRTRENMSLKFNSLIDNIHIDEFIQ
jgi:hypothetical protein